MNTLKSKTTENKEYVFVIKEQNNNLDYKGIAGSEGSQGIDLSLTGQIDGFIHSHYEGCLSIFSPDDITSIAGLYNNGNISDLDTFIEGVVTASGTQYYLMIDDASEFGTFASNLTAMYGKNFTDIYNKLFKINSDNTAEINEANFIRFLDKAKTGLKLLKGSPDMKNWDTKSIDENNNIKSTNCN